MKSKRVWSFAGIFMIMLVISIPFYISDAYAASISITKNQGEDGVTGYLDADGDTWTVESTIYGDNSTISPSNVKIKIGSSEDTFNSCSGSSGLSGVVCKYISPLTSGIIPGIYDFSVFYNYPSNLSTGNKSISASDKIKADGSTLSDGYTTALKVDLKSVKQDVSKNGIILDFTVEDQPSSYCSGLSKIEIIDTTSTSNSTLQTLTNFTAGKCSYDYKTDSGTNGLLAANFSGGDGYRWIKVKATDKLGHQSLSGSASFYGDFTPPKIDSNTLSFVDFGSYVGQYEATTDISINITEKNKLAKVLATSNQTKQSNTAASCSIIGNVTDLWTCIWDDIKVIPSSTISIMVTAEDDSGNQVNATVSKTLTVDSTVPKATYFGTARTYNSLSYVSGLKSVENVLILKVDESGAGMSSDGVRASLSGLGGSSSDQPDSFNTTTYESRWDIDYSGSGSEILVGLSKFQDKVGNIGTMPQLKVQVDSDGPDVDKIEVYGVSTTAGQKDYFQSNDKLNIELKIDEQSGLLILVDLNDLVNDAETSYPDSKVKEYFPELNYDYSGWMVFTEKDCTGTSKNWTCKLETPALKSGPDSSAALNIEVYDTAGNLADTWSKEPANVNSGSKGKYLLNLLGLATEENPDYWEVGSITPMGGSDNFIDMHTTQKMSSRMAFTVNLKTNSTAQAAKIELSSCTPESGFTYKQREVIFDNLLGEATANPSPIIILEFAPFDAKTYFKVTDTKGGFEKSELKYNCTLNVYSIVGKNAIKNAEVQQVGISIPFAFSDLGSLEENLDNLVADAKDGYYEDTEWISTLAEIIDWINYVLRVVNIIVALVEIYELITTELKITSFNTKEAGNSPVAFMRAVGTALDGTCATIEYSQTTVWKYISYLQVPASILSCSPGGSSISTKIAGQKGTASAGEAAFDSTNWYFKYQRTVLKAYNVVTGRSMLGIEAKSLYDNFYVAMIGLCVPGLVYNLQQLRELHCRKIVCLEKEVPQGIATVESCNNLFELQYCEFFAGPAIALIPGMGIGQMIGDAIESIFSSPLGLINLLDVIVCGALCFMEDPGLMKSACKVTKFLTKILEITETIVGMVKNRPDLTSNPYCGMVDDIEESKESTSTPTTNTTKTT